ncbi:MAG: SH3 domain-containing protein [Clostridia bacterium]|nr:SH3 domain-containing protein [Clostridia bacterium]
MKVIKIKRRTIFKFSGLIVFALVIGMFTNSFSMQSYYNTGFTTGLTTSNLNLRSGPGTNYKIVTTVPKNQYIRVFAGVGDWYIVQVEGDYVGAVSKKYVKPIYPKASSSGSSSNSSSGGSGETSSSGSGATTASLSTDEQEVFNLVNQQRTSNGLSALKIDSEVQNVARIKAKDMVQNNYFSHNSPTYGTPFNMLNNFKVSYKSAGENIAGNSSNSAAVTAWMNSSGHRANILNSSYNYTGIGVVNGSQYGKIYVQMFIGR